MTALKKQQYLITGGAGFIGGFLTESLIADGHQVTVADNFSTGSRDNLAAVKDSSLLTVIETDVSAEAEKIDELIRNTDVVIHLAAAVGVELVVNDPVRTISTNVRGTENVLIPAAKYGKRILIASTSEVYGKSENELFKETDDLRLGSPYRSRWSYACSKLLDEFMLMAQVQSAGLRGTIVRFFNTVGPRQTGRYGMVVPRFVGAAIKGAALKVYGDGQQSRCFCHVADVVRAVKLLLADDRSIGNVYNVGSQELITIEGLARQVIAETRSASPIEYVPYDQAYGKGFEDMRRRRPDTSAIRKLVGWQPEYTLAQVIRDVQEEMEKKR